MPLYSRIHHSMISKRALPLKSYNNDKRNTGALARKSIPKHDFTHPVRPMIQKAIALGKVKSAELEALCLTSSCQKLPTFEILLVIYVLFG